MITTGTKYFVGLTVGAAAGLITYAIASDSGSLGVVGLASALVALAFLAFVASFVRDGAVSANDTAALEASGAAQPAPWASAWPAVTGIGIAIIAVGLVTLQAFFILGIVVAGAGLAEWTVQAWAERSSSDRGYNAKVRGRMIYPLELPIAGVLLLAGVVFGFSRLMLAISPEAGPVLFAVFGTIILLFGFLIARSSNVSKTTIAGIVAVALVGMAAAGVAFALTGERDGLAKAAEEDHFSEVHRECDEKEHEFDHDASQAVDAKANVVAFVHLTDEGLYAEQVGYGDERLTTVVIPRSIPASIIFYNETSEPRRLNVEMGETAVEGTDPVVYEPNITCTRLTNEGGEQYVQANFPMPSFASETPFRMVVPGVEGTEILIEVP